MKLLTILTICSALPSIYGSALYKRDGDNNSLDSNDNKDNDDNNNDNDAEERRPSIGVEKVLHLPIIKRKDGDVLKFFADVAVGTPQQHLKLELDTASAGISVVHHAFDQYSSSSYQDQQAFGTDLFSWMSVQLGQLSLNVKSSDSENGRNVLGLATLNDSNSDVPSFLESLVEDSHINTNAFSLYLNAHEPMGSIMFGGFDRSKYVAPLHTMPLIGDSGKFIVELTELKFEGDNMLGGSSVPVLLDTSTNMNFIPEDKFKLLISSIDSEYVHDTKEDVYLIHCSAAEDRDIGFSFNGAEIKVAPKSYTTDMYDGPFGYDTCSLQFKPTSGQSSLGSSFIQHAYIVFDSHNHQIALGQAILDRLAGTNLIIVPIEGEIMDAEVSPGLE